MSPQTDELTEIIAKMVDDFNGFIKNTQDIHTALSETAEWADELADGDTNDPEFAGKAAYTVLKGLAANNRAEAAGFAILTTFAAGFDETMQQLIDSLDAEPEIDEALVNLLDAEGIVNYQTAVGLVNDAITELGEGSEFDKLVTASAQLDIMSGKLQHALEK